MLVAVVAFGAKVMSRNGSGANSLAQTLDALPRSGSVALIVQERENIIVMNAASRTLTLASKPTLVNPAQVIAAANASSSSTSTTIVNAPPPNSGTAQSIGYKMLPQFGFNQTTQWTCLLDLWNRESNWLYDAENPSSGAYGIPQALPGDKMASVAADWQTNPATQIKWGLGYITQVYGTPCNAYNFDVANGGY
jgi:resuscitation-promoting factor RpfB